MAKLIAIHHMTDNSEDYLKYYMDNHVPLARRLPGLQSYELSTGPINDDGEVQAQLVAVLTFPDLATIEKALAGPEGQDALDDVTKFAPPGVMRLMTFDTRPA